LDPENANTVKEAGACVRSFRAEEGKTPGKYVRN